MLLTEYNEEEHMKATYKEGYEDGEQAGRNELLREQIQKKLVRGKSIEQIAVELEEDTDIIQVFVKKISKK